MNESKHFVICIENGEYAGTLELRKVYEVLEDSAAAARDCAHIIDESAKTTCIRHRGSYLWQFRETSKNCSMIS